MDTFLCVKVIQKVSHKDTFCAYKILRNEARHGAIVLIRIRHIVGVELELVVIPVEDRRLGEVVIRIRSFYYFPSESQTTKHDIAHDS